MSLDAVENDSIKLVVLKNPYMDPEIISLSLLEVASAHDSSYSLRLKLQTPSMGGCSPSLKESMVATLGKLFSHPCASVTKQYNLVLAKWG